MERIPWSEIRNSLKRALLAALPLQLARAEAERIAGIGMHIDAYYGCAGLYLLPESAACKLPPAVVDNIGDWPISTDWSPSDDYSKAFAAHWSKWGTWFRERLDEHTGDLLEEKSRGLLRVACEAMREVNAEIVSSLTRTEDFRIIIAEHDEPDNLSRERFNLFCDSGIVRCDGDET